MTYTISIGSNEHRRENMALARQRLSALFPDIRYSTEEETAPLFLRRSALFSNQVARFTSDAPAAAVTRLLKAIEREAGRRPEDKAQEIVRLDLDLLAGGDTPYKPQDLERDYVRRGIEELMIR